MDPVCHTLAGAALAETGLKNRTALGAATLLIGANLPDVDVFAYLDGPTTALCVRRGVTHGVLAWLVLPLLLTGIMLLWDRFVRRRGRKEPTDPVVPLQLFLLALLGVLSHPALDLLNTYGIRLLMPFAPTWFYGDTLFIVDPWMWAILATGVFLQRKRAGGPRPVRVWLARPAVTALVVAIAYIGAMALSNVWARSIVARVAGERGIPVERMMVSPLPVTPFRRWVVVDDGERYHFGEFDWLGSPRFLFEAYTYERNAASPEAAAASRDPRARDFLIWARFPYAEVGASAVWLADARYTLDPEGSWAGVRVGR